MLTGSDSSGLRSFASFRTMPYLPGQILKADENLRRLEMKDKIQGKAEEIKGKVTRDKGLQVKGKARQKVGGVKESAKAIAYDMEHPRKER
jgi:uncharacterized protein YjbJ (UPF0337 family)